MEQIIKNTREKCPLVHCITNYVTVNDVANVILACGGSPIMTNEILEVREMQNICQALVINIGTLTERTIAAMIAAGKRANELGNPVVLDPVGAGATTLRTETVFKLLKEVKFSVIKGNISEIKTVALGAGETKGVDASTTDLVTEENLEEVLDFASSLSSRTGAIIAITGPIDVIATKDEAYVTYNGTKAMGKITGTGCMAAGVVAALVTANKGNELLATVKAISMMGLAGEIASNKALGTGTLHIGIIDAISNMTDEVLENGAQILKKR